MLRSDANDRQKNVGWPSGNISLWCPALKPRPDAPLRLICFPYAGGGMPIFRAWPAALPEMIDLRVVQLPGRGPRLREERFESMAPLIDALEEALYAVLDRPFCFFGHSLGALIAFEMARRLRRRGIAPSHLFASGNNAPQFPRHAPRIHELPDHAFLQELTSLNGIPPMVLDSKELMELFLPTIRSDFILLETYACDQSDAPLECPITAFGGRDDPRTTPEGLEAWRVQTSATFDLAMLPGGHFFLETARPLLVQTIAARMRDRSFPTEGAERAS
jgi:medium-chain acyl-[acyl-carrier-protein] hydrolase